MCFGLFILDFFGPVHIRLLGKMDGLASPLALNTNYLKNVAPILINPFVETGALKRPKVRYVFPRVRVCMRVAEPLVKVVLRQS